MSQNITNTANINASNSMFCFQCEDAPAALEQVSVASPQ